MDDLRFLTTEFCCQIASVFFGVRKLLRMRVTAKDAFQQIFNVCDSILVVRFKGMGLVRVRLRVVLESG